MSAIEPPTAATLPSPVVRGAVSSRAFGRDLARRVGTLTWFKAVGTTAFMGLFFAGYFHLLRHPAGPVATMPLTAVDHWIAFTPWALWPYLSLWLYVALPPALLLGLHELLRYGLWVGGLCVAGLACFMGWPTAVPSLVPGTEHAGFALLRGVDAAGNACPSLHVATASFSALWLHHLLRETAAPRWAQVGNVIWSTAIVWSTLATKQHVWWDVVAGVALALLFAPASLPRAAAARGDGDIIERRR